MTTLPAFCKSLTEAQFDVLLDLSSEMSSWYAQHETTHYCDVEYLDLQEAGEELAKDITAAGFTYEQVEEFTFSE